MRDLIISTDRGIFVLENFEVSEKYEASNVYDSLFNGDALYVCSVSDGLLRYTETGWEKIIDEACWRIIKIRENKFIVSIEGPKIYEFDAKSGEATLLSDITQMSREYSWWSPVGKPHLTDFTFYNGLWIGTVEVGGVISSSDLSEWHLQGLKGVDAHNILSLKNRVFVAAASGIYYSEDLEEWKKSKSPGYYNHAIIKCGEKLISHVMEKNPIIISGDKGETWRTLHIEMQKPTYGQTVVYCLERNRIIYAPSKVYTVNIEEAKKDETGLNLPRVRRIGER